MVLTAMCLGIPQNQINHIGTPQCHIRLHALTVMSIAKLTEVLCHSRTKLPVRHHRKVANVRLRSSILSSVHIVAKLSTVNVNSNLTFLNASNNPSNPSNVTFATKDSPARRMPHVTENHPHVWMVLLRNDHGFAHVEKTTLERIVASATSIQHLTA